MCYQMVKIENLVMLVWHSLLVLQLNQLHIFMVNGKRVKGKGEICNQLSGYKIKINK